MRLYAEIQKVEEQEDGTLKVFGVASSECVDSAGEVITAQAMRSAIPDYMRFGAVREMHDAKKAAGTAISCNVEEDGKTYLEALVVDSEAIKKVQHGVYKGFSVGGKTLHREGKIIDSLKLVEISLVDRPCNPEAIFSITKLENDMELDLSKFEGQEVYDARMAMEALLIVMQLCQIEESEMENESEQTTLLRDVMAKLKAFIASEIVEDHKEKTMEMADPTGDIEKAGKKFSKANLEKMQSAYSAVTKAMQEFSKLWDEKDEEEDEEEEKCNTKVEDVDIAKIESEKADALAKVASLENDLAKAKAEVEDLKKQKPLKPVPIEKAEETGDVKKALESKDPLTIMKSIHAVGGRPGPF
jgi:phage head maturation protease